MKLSTKIIACHEERVGGLVYPNQEAEFEFTRQFLLLWDWTIIIMKMAA